MGRQFVGKYLLFVGNSLLIVRQRVDDLLFVCLLVPKQNSQFLETKPPEATAKNTWGFSICLVIVGAFAGHLFYMCW